MWRRFIPQGLRAQIMLWSLVPTLVILIAVGYFSAWAYSSVTEALVQDRNRELTRLLAGQVSLELADHLEVLGDLREARNMWNSPASWNAVLDELGPQLRNFDAGVVVLNSEGVVVATDPRRIDARGLDWSGASFFAHLSDSPAPLLLSSVEPVGLNGSPAVGVTVAIIDAQGRVERALVGLFSVAAHSSSPFYRGILALNLRSEAELALVDAHGVAIYHSDPRRIGQTIRDEAPVAWALEGQPGAMRTTDAQGREVIASYAPIPSTTCYLVEVEGWRGLQALAVPYGRWLVLILSLALIIPAIVVSSAARLITRPVRNLTVAANAMSRGEMHQIIDRPAAAELGELADAFNRMAAQVQGLYASLEARVRSRTRELSAMNAIAGVVSASLDLREILAAALDKLLQLMAMDAGWAYRLSPGGDVLVPMARAGRRADDLPDPGRLPLALFSTREALDEGALVIAMDDMPDDGLWRTARADGWRQVVLVPLASKDELLGLIVLLAYVPRRIAHSERSLLAAIGSQIGVAMENGRLYQEAGRLAVMAERNRLAQDLHDSVTQTIFTANLLAGVIPLIWDKDPAEARTQLDEVARLTRAALAEMRALLLELRPATMAQVPLGELLARLAEATQSNARLEVLLNASARHWLPSRVRVALYRIAQEAVNNVVKHAAASRVWISLTPLPSEDGYGDGAVLTIRDDGQGFDPDKVRDHHLGLAIMRERAGDIRAELTIMASPGQGTVVQVTWVPPVLPHEDEESLGDGQEREVRRGSWRITAEEGEGALEEDELG